METIVVAKRNLIGSPLERASRFMFTRLVASLARTLRDEDLSVVQLAALHVVDQAGELKQSTLATELAMSPSAASRMVDGLVTRGLVERRESPDDRRVRALRLSPRGAELLDETGEARAQLIERVTRPLPRAMVNLFLTNLERLRAAGVELLGRKEEE